MAWRDEPRTMNESEVETRLIGKAVCFGAKLTNNEHIDTTQSFQSEIYFVMDIQSAIQQ